MNAEQRDALGSTADLPKPLARALLSSGFTGLRKPGPSDWLSVHREAGQTFREFVAGRPPAPDARHKTLALVPIGTTTHVVPAELLRRYTEAFFQLPAELLPPVSVAEMHAETRVNSGTGRRQLRAPDVLGFLRSRLPVGAFALCGFTHEDLYPEKAWNFVFGQASLRERVGVFSFARYDPLFFGLARTRDYEPALRRRCMNVLVHETGHMFGLAHCVYFACVMNGSNHLEETDRRPFHACPVCLRKLQHSVGFDVQSRYVSLERLYSEAGFDDERVWTQRRLEEIVAR